MSQHLPLDGFVSCSPHPPNPVASVTLRRDAIAPDLSDSLSGAHCCLMPCWGTTATHFATQVYVVFRDIFHLP